MKQWGVGVQGGEGIAILHYENFLVNHYLTPFIHSLFFFFSFARSQTMTHRKLLKHHKRTP